RTTQPRGGRKDRAGIAVQAANNTTTTTPTNSPHDTPPHS
ncbi:hypothetical protein Pmani_032473, partial [Petrolisthes manimaculis]